ncbi:MAG: hypothetical protein ACM3ZT_06220 [Bacillota bacterium]
MYPLFVLAKYFTVVLFGASGVLFVSRGFGMPIPFLEYGELEAWNVLAGAVLLTVSVAAAVFWDAPRRARSKPRRANPPAHHPRLALRVK